MNTKTRTVTAGWPGPFTEAEAQEFADSLDSSFMTVLAIVQGDDGWYVHYAYKITTTLRLLDTGEGRG